jgi:hypothetical protein
VVRAIDLEDADLSLAPEGLRSLSWTGPRFVATRPPTADESQDTLMRGLAGQDIGMRPAFWLPLSATASSFARAAQPLTRLLRSPQTAEVRAAIVAAGLPEQAVGYLPILARSTNYSALVNLKDGEVVGYAPVDGF